MRSNTGFDRLIDLLETERSICATTGYSGVEVYHLPDLNSYLKIGPVGKVSDLKRESAVLLWLEGKAPVPRLSGYGSDGDREALMISAVPGTPASEFLSANGASRDEIERFIYECAKGLRLLHDLKIGDCPFDWSLPVRFDRCRRTIELGLLSETDEDFMAEHNGDGPWEVYDQLLASCPENEELVFTHGDPSMPNILVNDGTIAGFIDLDGAGIADRYVDIAIFFRSFLRNSRLPIDPEPLFCQGYGIDRLDLDRMAFYRTIDDLF